MYQYPYGNAQQLNLDWILGKLQELEAGSGGGADLEEVANALVSASFDAGVSYRKYDYCFYNGKLYRALNDTIGAFNPADWMEVTLGADIPVLTRLLNAVDTSLTSLQTTVGNQGTAITNLQNAVGDLDSDDVDNASNVTGTTVTAALDNLNGAIKFLLTSTGDDTDRYSDIMYCLNNYGACVLGDGIFYINSTIGMPDGTSLSGIGVGSVLQLKDNSAGNIAINVGSYCSVENLTIKGKSTPLSYTKYTQGNRGGIALLGDATDFEHPGTFTHNFAKLHNLTITDFDGFGIRGYKNDGAASFQATNIDILRCHTGIDIRLFSEFHTFTNVRCRWCNIACRNNGGNNIFSACHFDTNVSGYIMKAETGETIVNGSHSTLIGCTINHTWENTDYSIRVDGAVNGLIVDGCQIFGGYVRIENSNGVSVTNCNFGSNIIIIADTSPATHFINNVFAGNPTINIPWNNVLIWENNTLLSGAKIFNVNARKTLDGSLYYNEGITPDIYTEVMCYTELNATSLSVTVQLPFLLSGVRTRQITVSRVVVLGVAQLDITNLVMTAQESNYFRFTVPISFTPTKNIYMVNVKYTAAVI